MATLPITITLSVSFNLHCSFVQFLIPCGLFIYLFIYCAVRDAEYSAQNNYGLVCRKVTFAGWGFTARE